MPHFIIFIVFCGLEKILNHEIPWLIFVIPDFQAYVTSAVNCSNVFGSTINTDFDNDLLKLFCSCLVSCSLNILQYLLWAGSYMLSITIKWSSHYVFFSFACNKTFCSDVDQMAFTSLQCSLWNKNHYDQVKRNENFHHSTLRYLANNLKDSPSCIQGKHSFLLTNHKPLKHGKSIYDCLFYTYPLLILSYSLLYN